MTAPVFRAFYQPWSVKQTLKVLESIFRFRSCDKPITARTSVPALISPWSLPGACTGYVSKEEYKEAVKQIVLFLEGKRDKVVREIEQQMKSCF